MGFHVSLAELTKAATKLSQEAERLEEQLETAKKSVNKIITSEALTGQTGQAIYHQLNNVDAAILVGLADTTKLLASDMYQLIAEFQASVGETSTTAVLDEDYLNQLKDQLSNFKNQHGEQEETIAGIYASVSDLISLSSPQSNYDTDSDAASQYLSNTIDKVTSFNSAGSELSSESLLTAIDSKVNQVSQTTSLSYSDSQYLSFVNDASFAKGIKSVNKQLKEQEKLAKEEAAKEAQAAWAKQHPVEAWLQSQAAKDAQFFEGARQTLEQTHWDYFGGAVDKSLALSVLGFISKASETVDQLAIGIGELSHLAVEGIEWGGNTLFNQTTPQWIKDDVTGATNNLLAASEFTDSLLALDAEAWGAVGKELGKIGTDFVTAVKTGDDYALGGYAFDVATLVGPASISKLKYVDEASALTKLAETSEVASTVGKVEEGVKVSKFDKLFGKLNKKNIKSVTFNNTKTINKIDFVVTDINDSKALSIPKQLNGYEEYANFLKEVGDSNLSLEEKVENLQKAYYRIQDKTDIQVPIHAKYVKSIENGQIEYDWLGKLGFQENTIQAITRESGLPDIWERSGYMGGGNFSDLPQTGPYTNSEKAIPYIPNPAASHTGTFNTKTYFEKIDAINDGDLEKLNSILKEESIKPFSNSEFKKLKFKYENYVDYTAKSLGITRENVLYGVHGKAAAWHELAGGAEQIVTPFNGFIMENLGILGE